LVEASVPKFKKETKQLLDWAIDQTQKVGVRTLLKTEVTADLVKRTRPEALIVAVGSDWVIPKVIGCDRACVVTADNVFLSRKTVAKNLVVVGAGLIGCETALFLADELNKKVTVVDILEEMLIGIQGMCKMALTERLQEAGVKINLGWQLNEITDTGVVCIDRDFREHETQADSVVLATGLMPRTELIGQFKGLTPELYLIGDCVKVGKIYNAFEDAWRAALLI
jgi:2-enoate reductase